jgi:hypothetical protein
MTLLYVSGTLEYSPPGDNQQARLLATQRFALTVNQT